MRSGHDFSEQKKNPTRKKKMEEVGGGSDCEEISEHEDDDEDLAMESAKIVELGESWRRTQPKMAELPEQNNAESVTPVVSSEEEVLEPDDPRPDFFALRNNRRYRVIKKRNGIENPKSSACGGFKEKKTDRHVEDGSGDGNPKIGKRKSNKKGNLLIDGATTTTIRKIERLTRSRKGLRSQAIELLDPFESLDSVDHLQPLEPSRANAEVRDTRIEDLVHARPLGGTNQQDSTTNPLVTPIQPLINEKSCVYGQLELRFGNPGEHSSRDGGLKDVNPTGLQNSSGCTPGV